MTEIKKIILNIFKFTLCANKSELDHSDKRNIFHTPLRALSKSIQYQYRSSIQFLKNEYGIIILLFTVSSALSFVFFNKNPWPEGSDAFVYLVQARSLLELGTLHYPDFSIIHPLMACATLLPVSAITAYKIVCAFLFGFFIVSVYFAGKTISKGKNSALACSILCGASPLCLFFASQFPKQFFAMSFFVLFTSCVSQRKIFFSILFFVLSLATHRTAAGLCFGFIIIHLAINRVPFKLLIAILLSITAGMTLLSLLPGTLHIYDVQRFAGSFQKTFIPSPAAFADIFEKDKIHPLLYINIWILYSLAIMIFLFALISFLRKKKTDPYVLSMSILLALLLFPYFTVNGSSIGYRFLLSALSIAPVAVPGIPIPRIKLIFPVILIYSIAGIFYVHGDNSARYAPPYGLYTKIVSRIETEIHDKDVQLIIAHRPLAEMIDYYLRKDALAWKPESRFDKTKTWRIAWGIENWEIERVTPKSIAPAPKIISPQYIIVREDRWNVFIQTINKRENPDLFYRAFSEQNPSKERPLFITRGR